MAAAYDTYDYPSYWIGRDYEHRSEVIAIQELLKLVPSINTILDIGAGFGRLTPYYSFRAKKIIITDPSARLLKIARSELRDKKYVFSQSTLENIPSKIKNKSVDFVFLIRVLHHINDPVAAFQIIYKLLKPNGYFLIEYANKQHFKAQFSEIFKGNLTFPLDIFPVDLHSKKRKKMLPFKNYHPDIIKRDLEEVGFDIVEQRSVSNIRSGFFKKVLSNDILIEFEKVLQKPFAKVNFGPSMFYLCKKRG